MSSLCGATDDLANEFEKIPYGPYIIFGSIDERNYNEYAVAWTILYNLFKTKGVHRDVAMEALRAIRAIAHNNFRYLRWKDDKKEYVQYPPEGRRFCRNGEEAESEIAVPAAARSAQADCRSRTVELGKFFCPELTILIRQHWPTLALTLQLLRVSRPGATSNWRIYRQSDAGDYIASSCSSSGDLTRLRLA